MSEWIEFDCGDENRECPVSLDAIVEVKLRGGTEWLAKNGEQELASYWYWSNGGYDGDIVAYRVIE